MKRHGCDGKGWQWVESARQGPALTSVGSAAVLAQKRLLRAMPVWSAALAAGREGVSEGECGQGLEWGAGADLPGGVSVRLLGTRFSAGFRGLRGPPWAGAPEEASVLICGGMGWWGHGGGGAPWLGIPPRQLPPSPGSRCWRRRAGACPQPAPSAAGLGAGAGG